MGHQEKNVWETLPQLMPAVLRWLFSINASNTYLKQLNHSNQRKYLFVLVFKQGLADIH